MVIYIADAVKSRSDFDPGGIELGNLLAERRPLLRAPVAQTNLPFSALGRRTQDSTALDVDVRPLSLRRCQRSSHCGWRI